MHANAADDNLALTPYNSGGVLGAVGSGVGMIGSGAMYVPTACSSCALCSAVPVSDLADGRRLSPQVMTGTSHHHHTSTPNRAGVGLVGSGVTGAAGIVGSGLKGAGAWRDDDTSNTPNLSHIHPVALD